MQKSQSEELFKRASRVIPGGVNSPVRAFKAVGGCPLFISSGSGALLTDADGNELLDCVGSWGPLILGHAHPEVMEAMSLRLAMGTTFGAPTRLEVELSEMICRAVPSVKKVRLVCSGTEATMSALRVARGFTGRNKVVKFEGCYHGHADFLLAKAGSGVATLGLPECAGIPESMTADTLTLPYNDVQAARDLFAKLPTQIACVIVEPVAGNMGCVPPAPGFLEALRELTSQYGALLLFDEVMTGFRVAFGGAQARYGIVPDLTCLGKVVGGGMPLAAYGGRAEIMDCVAPVGPVYQAGTLAGNPIAVTAGLTTLEILDDDPDAYARLDAMGNKVAQGLRAAAAGAGVPAVVNQVGSMLTLFFTDQPAVTNYAQANLCDRAAFARWFGKMLESGIYWPPSPFECAFLNLAMTDADIVRLIEAAGEAMAK